MGHITGRRISMLPVPTGMSPPLASAAATPSSAKGTPTAGTGRASSLGARAAAVAASATHGARNGASTGTKGGKEVRGAWR